MYNYRITALLDRNKYNLCTDIILKELKNGMLIDDYSQKESSTEFSGTGHSQIKISHETYECSNITINDFTFNIHITEDRIHYYCKSNENISVETLSTICERINSVKLFNKLAFEIGQILEEEESSYLKALTFKYDDPGKFTFNISNMNVVENNGAFFNVIDSIRNLNDELINYCEINTQNYTDNAADDFIKNIDYILDLATQRMNNE